MGGTGRKHWLQDWAVVVSMGVSMVVVSVVSLAAGIGCERQKGKEQMAKSI